MGSDQGADDRASRRAFLKAGGAGALTLALAGCDELPEEGEGTEDGGSGNESDGSAGTGTPGGDGGDGGSDDPRVADVAYVNTEFAAEESDLVRATFGEEYYTRIEGLPGLDTPEGATPVGHAATYGHEMIPPESVAGDAGVPEGQPFLRVLSAGMLSLPTLEEGPGNPYADAPLSELVAAPEENLLLAAAGLGPTVEWLSEPVSVEQTEADFFDGTATVETFVGPVSAEPGPGMPTDEDDAFLDDGTARPGAYMATVHTARGFVGGDVVMTGMVGGWRRPPSMDPRVDDIGPGLSDLLSDIYQDLVRTAMFLGVLSQAERDAAALMPDEEDRPPGYEKESRRETISTRYGLGAGDQIELGYPNEEEESDTVFDVVTFGRDAPGLFSGVPYDPDVHSRGTKIYLTVETNGVVYPLDDGDDVAVGFGVMASPLVQAGGEERNPLAADSTADAMNGFEGVWDLLRWVIDADDVGWTNGPSEFEDLSNLTLLGQGTTADGFDGEVLRAVDGTPESDPVTFYLSRVTTADEVILAVAFTFEDGDDFFADGDAAKRLVETALDDVVQNPGTPSPFVEGSIDDLDLVQVAADTRIETGSGDVLPRSDPDLVEGRNTAPTFDVTTFSDSSDTSRELRYGVFEFDVANRAGVAFDTLIDEWGLNGMDTGGVAPDFVFDRHTNRNDPVSDHPVFELQGSDSSVTMSFRAPSGYTYDDSTIRDGSDYDVTGMDVLRIGVIPVIDPDRGDNYGDSGGGPTLYDDTVEAAFEYIKRTYPTGIAMYRHDGGMEGVTKAFSSNAKKDETSDYQDARIALERIAKPANNNWSYSGDTLVHQVSESNAINGIQNNGFDVWVMIIPDGYYDFHRTEDESKPAGLAPGDDSLAVTTKDADAFGPNRAFAAEVVAQEIGHRLKSDPYRTPASGNGESNPMAQRDDSGTDDGNRDFDHARHLNSSLDGNMSGSDGPGLVSRAFSLADGEFVVPSNQRWSGGYVVDRVDDRPAPNGTYGPTSRSTRVGRVESYMSYTQVEYSRNVWADSLVTQDIIDGDLNRDPGNFRAYKIGGVTEVPGAAAGGDGGDATATVNNVRVSDGLVRTPDEERLAAAESLVTVTVSGPEGVLAERQVPFGVAVEGHDVDDNRLDDVAPFDVELPQAAVRVSVDGEDVDLAFNPITRPIRDAFGRLPERGLGTGFDRARLDETLATVDAAMAERAFGEARETLATYAEERLPNAVNPEFEPLANQPDEARLRALFGEMIGRLDGLAGDDTGDDIVVGEAPAWTDWVPEPSALPVFEGSRGFWQYDVASVVTSGGMQAKAGLEDPMANPFFGGLFGQLLWEQLAALGLAEAVLGAAAIDDVTDPSAVPAETGVVLGNAQVYLGDFDTARLDAAVAENPVEESDTPGVYVYTENEFAFAYGDGYVVGAPTVDEVVTMLETSAGDRTRWADAEAEVQWLYEAGAQGDFSLVNHVSTGTLEETGDAIDLSPFLSAKGVAQSASLNGETFTDATTALVYPSEDAVELSALRETLGLEATERTVSQDGRYVQVRASYGE